MGAVKKILRECLMDLYIKSIVIKNFMRIRSTELEFPEEGVIGILAQGAEDPDRSNFMGKTTILEAIRYCYTGKSRADKEVELIHHGQELMYVETVTVDRLSGEQFKIRRGRTIKNEGLIEYSDSKHIGEKSQEAEKLIQDLLGLSPEDFDLTIFFKQAEINQFMTLGPTEQKKMLMKWQNNGHWTEKEKNVLTDIKILKDEIKKYQITLDNLNNDVGNLEKLQQENTRLDIICTQYTDSINKLKTKLESLLPSVKVTESEYQRADREITDVRKRLYELRTEEEKNELELKTYKEVHYDYEEHNTELSSVSSKIAVLKSQIAAEREKYDQLMTAKHGICPILKESCERIVQTGEQKSQILTSISAKEKEIKELNSRCDHLASRISLYKKSKEIEASTIKKIEKSKTESLLLKQRLKIAHDTVNAFNREAFAEVKFCTEQIRRLEELFSDVKLDRAVIREKLRVAEENEKKANELRASVNHKLEKLENLMYLAYMFGKNGIPSLEIENSFQVIEDEINYLLGEVVDKELIFKPDRELNTWEDFCLSCGFKYPKGYKKPACQQCHEPRRKKRKDELSLSVVEDGNEISFDMCSGGLKTLVSLAVRTALTLLRKRQNRSNLNIIFLDEIDSALDKTNKDHIINLINNVLHKKLGFKQIFWISHDKTISHNVPQTLLVKGYETYSKVGWL
jgi:DNA repair exonuclease SbcCD ATPase subunit